MWFLYISVLCIFQIFFFGKLWFYVRFLFVWCFIYFLVCSEDKIRVILMLHYYCKIVFVYSCLLCHIHAWSRLSQSLKIFFTKTYKYRRLRSLVLYARIFYKMLVYSYLQYNCRYISIIETKFRFYCFYLEILFSPVPHWQGLGRDMVAGHLL